MAEDFDLEAFDRWTPSAKKAAAERLQAAVSIEARAWYCTSPGRECDGKPHEGYPYPHARGDQWPPPGMDWFTWLLSGGRGSGKTRSGAEYTRKITEYVPRSAIIAPTGPDARETCIEGESGLIRACENAGLKGWEWEPSKRRFTFPNGHIATTFSGEEPDRLRGPQHGFAWLDEPAHIALIEQVWSNLLFGLRLGKRPHVLCTTTPLPNKWTKRIAKDPLTRRVAVSTYKNLDNLAANYRITISQFEGTRLGRQELHGEILEDTDGALWLESYLRRAEWVDLGFDRVIIGLDPAGTANKRSDETGIVVAARKGDMFYVINDRSGRMSPESWATTTLSLYEMHLADAITPETNYGGDMVTSTLRNLGMDAVFIKPVNARRGKALRAEPIVALYEQGRVVHMAAPGANLETLETEMLEWVPGVGDSPNRVDALVHALTELVGAGGGMGVGMPVGIVSRAPAMVSPSDVMRMGVLGGLR